MTTSETSLTDVDRMISHLEQDCGFSIPEIKHLLQRAIVKHVLDRAHGNVSKAARMCGKHRNGLSREMKKFGFSIRQWDRRGSRGARRQKVYEAFAAGETRPDPVEGVRP